MRILVTGFAPFGEDEENPSWEAARALDGSDCEGARLLAVRLPVSWGRAAAMVADAVQERRPVAVIMAGLAAGRAGIAVEEVFVNTRNGRDDAGIEAHEAPVVAGGPTAIGATVAVAAIVRDLRAAGIPADPSRSAGTYVCNATAYAVLQGGPGVPVGFVHVPATPAMVVLRQARAAALGREVAALPSMAQETIRRALWIAARTVVRTL